MSKWLTVREVCEILNLGESFVRCVICKPMFNQFVVFEKPIMIKFNRSFETLILSQAKGHNFKKVRKRPITDKPQHQLSTASIKHWSNSAYHCYNLKGDCDKCYIPQLMHERCRMKEVVPELIRKYGIPKNI